MMENEAIQKRFKEDWPGAILHENGLDIKSADGTPLGYVKGYQTTIGPTGYLEVEMSYRVLPGIAINPAASPYSKFEKIPAYDMFDPFNDGWRN